MTLSGKDQQWLRLSIVSVWLTTAFASVWELDGQSAQLLQAAGVQDASLARWLILGGAGVDAALGLAMLLWPVRWAYLAALAVMALMTLVASILDPSLWLHPLGPLTKNLPIAVLLLVLAKAKP
ncbi:MAG: DoxX-like family protein [Pseudomonadota bacterium]|uniref:DoxX-like family protein n=1 Tax=Polaromonas sp. TaxID=1869339 RepID=UPI001801CA3F|nr:DoxX-like family protein [Polaromonas sp.]MBA3592362.1 DoxX-like family protein [Polaromonas sp.]MDQ3272595.1 DoxX-like family protein [Pseudomonadota bacterium]